MHKDIPQRRDFNFTMRQRIDSVGGDSVTEGTTTLQWIDSKTGVDNPSWKAQIAQHTNAATDYSAVYYSVKREPGNGKVVQNGFLATPDRYYYADGYLLQSLTWPPVAGADQDLVNRTYEDFVKKANAKLQSVRSLSALAEIRQVIHMIRNPLQSLRDSIENYSNAVVAAARRAARGKPPQSKRRRKAILSAISGTYLEAQFGWKPLLSDIDGAVEALANSKFEIGPTYSRVKAKSKTETGRSFAPFVSSLSSFMQWDQYDTEVLKSSCHIVGEVVVSSEAQNADLRSRSGFNLSEFVPAIWEVIPYSFFIDYFSNVGQVIDALCFNRAAVTWIYQSSKVESKRTHSGQWRVPLLQPDAALGVVSSDGNPGTAVLTVSTFQRTPRVVYVPSLAFKIPGLGIKAMNTTALWAQCRANQLKINSLVR
ncbi:maturation protein [ssRNA phage Gerhypos.2_20]|uniref:Maturation protein n=2 Tax=Norzivirales TaxID=2842247 RepID=A0A8S5KZQ8_9VIRU|nr:maturation protein [ssRNA phage Gerhypos.2_20]QDH89178.1 MAG: hypothetical protein H2Bulk35286_000001 [Leviviridae sp.]DAD50338.1 TPA_asm: maturation protein [ssRNA phage Gerhypos.2_20]